MSVYKRSHPKPPVGVTEFEILKASHKFLRDEGPEKSMALTSTTEADDHIESTSSWNDQLAAKYYASLYREFALCDLKHYKSGNFALRWRTEDEVLSGAGETTCGNTRCEHHRGQPSSAASSSWHPSSSTSTSNVLLTTLELPFGYIEHGKSKNALVKVVLCARCLKKLMWKKNKEKDDRAEGEGEGDGTRRVDEGHDVGRDDGGDGRRGKEKSDSKQEREKSANRGKRKRERDAASDIHDSNHRRLRRIRDDT